MQVSQINSYVACCTAKGVERDVNLFLMQDNLPAVSDFVMVHVGYAIQTISPEAARSAWELCDEMLAQKQGVNHA